MIIILILLFFPKFAYLNTTDSVESLTRTRLESLLTFDDENITMYALTIEPRTDRFSVFVYLTMSAINKKECLTVNLTSFRENNEGKKKSNEFVQRLVLAHYSDSEKSFLKINSTQVRKSKPWNLTYFAIVFLPFKVVVCLPVEFPNFVGRVISARTDVSFHSPKNNFTALDLNKGVLVPLGDGFAMKVANHLSIENASLRTDVTSISEAKFENIRARERLPKTEMKKEIEKQKQNIKKFTKSNENYSTGMWCDREDQEDDVNVSYVCSNVEYHYENYEPDNPRVESLTRSENKVEVKEVAVANGGEDCFDGKFKIFFTLMSFVFVF